MGQRHVDVLIIGAGIAGLLLARELRRRGSKVAVAHDPARPGASEAAVGLLNPVRGLRCTLAWRAAEVFAAARETYAELGAAWGTVILRNLPVVRAFASARERSFFDRRTAALAGAGLVFRELESPPAGFRHAGFGVVAVEGGGALDAAMLTERLRTELRADGVLIEQRCAPGDLARGPAGWAWAAAHLQATQVVLAGGSADIADSLAGTLPLRPVRGESLLVRAPGLDPAVAYVCGHHLAPVSADFWSCGGTKVPGETSTSTTREGRAELEAFLGERLSVPWEIVGHLCGVRAATLDTKPIVGRITDDPRVVVFNGFGSQGYTVAPWLARVLADHLTGGGALPPEVDPARPGLRPPDPSPSRRGGVESS
jgi:glycine/D-amino acid oxidase-like deaminating enzyme